MRHFLFLTLLFLLPIHFVNAQGVQFLDSTALTKNPITEETQFVIAKTGKFDVDKQRDLYVNILLSDLPSQFDKLKINLNGKEYLSAEPSIFVIKKQALKLENKLSISFYKNDKKIREIKEIIINAAIPVIEKAPLVTDDRLVIGILLVALALIFHTASLKNKYWKKFYVFVPALLLCYLVPALLNTFGIISDKESGLYDIAKDYLLPAALILMTIGIDFKGIINLGPKALIMFFTATVGIIIGGPIAILIFKQFSPELVGGVGNSAAWRGFSTLAGSWIGGGANQAAMLETYNYTEALYGKMVTVDIVVANLWMAFLLWAAPRADKIDKWLKADSSAIEELKIKVNSYELANARVTTFKDYMLIFGITFGIVSLSHYLGQVIAPLFDPKSPFSSSFLWLVVFATTGGLICSFTKARKFEGAGAMKIGSVFIYFLVATIGMKMELHEAVKEPMLILVGIVWMLIHALLLFAVAKLIKAPFFFVAVGSKANVGGAASAPVVAAAFHPSLASVGALLAVLGYAIGTYGAIICARMMEFVAP